MSTRLGMLVAAVMAGAALTGGVRADRLEGQLNNRMGDIVSGLKKKYKSVGVLRFRVQEGTRAETFDSPLSGRMADRIETLVMIHNGPDESKALGLARDVSKTANKAKIGAWFSNPAERRKLFDQKYPMAWGSKSTSPDAFLTGKVALSKDRKQTIVTLESFDKDNPTTLRKLGSFTMNTDRFVLRDLGYSFGLTRQARSRLTAKRTMGEEDQNFVEEVNQQQPPKNDKPTPNPIPVPKQPGDARAEPESVGGVKVELLVKGEPVNIRPASTQGDAIRWQVDSPTPGSEVAIRLTNNSGKKLAVSLKLNGLNTINEVKDDPERTPKWNIPAGRAYTIRGFYFVEATNAEKKIKPFVVLAGEAARTAIAEMGEKKGLIEVDVFEEGTSGGDEMLISPKGMPPSKVKQARSSYLGLRSALLKSSKLTSTVETKKEGRLIVKREVIVPDKEAIVASEKIGIEEFPNPKLLSRLTIKVMPGETPPNVE